MGKPIETPHSPAPTGTHTPRQREQKHVCKPPTGCRCWGGDTPNEDCPAHGYPDNRCDCGRYISPKAYARAIRARAKE